MDTYAWGFRILQDTLALLAFIVGVDKFAYRMGEWHTYLSAPFSRLLPWSPRTKVKVAGIIEMAGGILILLFPVAGGFLAAIWLFLTGINLFLQRLHVFALRDFALAFSALALGLLAIGRPLC